MPLRTRPELAEAYPKECTAQDKICRGRYTKTSVKAPDWLEPETTTESESTNRSRKLTDCSSNKGPELAQAYPKECTAQDQICRGR